MQTIQCLPQFLIVIACTCAELLVPHIQIAFIYLKLDMLNKFHVFHVPYFKAMSLNNEIRSDLLEETIIKLLTLAQLCDATNNILTMK